jgi:diguanylate cyclase (GGDEF)-like protein/PAS domain S-box-containing protein
MGHRGTRPSAADRAAGGASTPAQGDPSSPAGPSAPAASPSPPSSASSAFSAFSAGPADPANGSAALAGALPAAWAAALADTQTVPMTQEQALRVVSGPSAQVLALSDDPDLARKVGVQTANALIDAHCFQSASLAASIEVLDSCLQHRLASGTRTALLAGLAAAFAEGLRERTRAEQASIHEAVLAAYRAGEARFRTVFRNAPLGIVITDRHGQVLEVNPGLADMLGVEPYTTRGRNIKNLMQVADPDLYWQRHDELVAGRRAAYDIDCRILRSDGGVVWTHLTANAVRDDSGDIALVIGLYEDVTERRHITEQLRHQATHDPLTGLPNRVRLLEEVDDLIRAAAPGERIGLCFLDLDGFKGVNDTLGHQAGDELLTEVARRLVGATDPRRHVVARMGGDEFVLLFPRTPGAGAVVEVVEAVLAAVRRPIVLDGHSLTVTASAGVVERPAAGASAIELLRAADMTLYWAKAAGKAGWALFDEERNAREVHRYALSQALPAALESGELCLVYQPIFSLTDGRPHTVEALARWNHPERGLLDPVEFVPMAEQTGGIVALGRWALRRAAADAMTWPATPDRPAPAVSVNVAVRQVREPGLLDDVREALSAAGLPPRRLCLEITESALMNTAEQGRTGLATLEALADSGIGIAVDDFGTGYSNLARLRDLPATSLKIDASFVADLDRDPADPSAESIMMSLVALAHACGMTVTAEGVETPRQARRLAELGVDYAQGFHYSRPVPAGEVPGLLRAWAALGAVVVGW